MKKNTLFLLLSLSTIFPLSAKLIHITVKSNDTFELAAFMSDNKGVTHQVNQYTSKKHSPKTTTHLSSPDFTWYTFDTSGYKGGQKTKGKYPHYIHLAINETATGDNKENTAKAVLQTIKAPKGTFKILGINPITGKINRQEGFIVTVK